MDWKTLFFSPDGRIGRQSFWIGWLVLLGVNVVLGWIPLIGWALSLVTIYCNVCITANACMTWAGAASCRRFR